MTVPRNLVLCLLLLLSVARGFNVPSQASSFALPHSSSHTPTMSSRQFPTSTSRTPIRPPTSLAVASFEQISLAASQENTGLAVVVVGEAVYSFSRAPGLLQSLILLPPLAAAYFLLLVAGPYYDMPSSDMSQGLLVSSLVSLALMLSYAARLKLPSASPKEYAFGGLLVGFAGFCSFAQNSFAGGFVTLPTIPLPALPSLPF